jgi:hypothetical protein
MRLLDLHKSSHLQPASWELWLHFIGLTKFLCFLQILVQKQEYLSKPLFKDIHNNQMIVVWKLWLWWLLWRFLIVCPDCYIQLLDIRICSVLSIIIHLSLMMRHLRTAHKISSRERTNTTRERRFFVIATGSVYYGIMQVLSFCIFLLHIPWNLMHTKKFQSIFVGYLIFMNIPRWKEEGSYISK